MSITSDITTGARPAATTNRGFADISARLTGAGALTFAGVVILQNIVRGSSAPGFDATSTDVLTSYADHRGVTFALIAMFVVSAIGLTVFLGGAMRRLFDSDRRGWALTGYVGGIGIMALFSVLVGAEQALSVVASRSQPDIGAIEALWALHNSVFTVLWVSIAVALLGLSRAGVAAGVTPRAFERLGPIGSGLLLIGAIGGPSVAAGDTMVLFAAGGIGFFVWLAFVASTGVRLVRSGEVR